MHEAPINIRLSQWHYEPAILPSSFSSVTQRACSSLYHTHLDTSQSVGLPWVRGRPVAEAATLTHNIHKTETSVPSTITFLCVALTLQWRTRCSVRTFNYSYAAGIGAPYVVNGQYKLKASPSFAVFGT